MLVRVKTFPDARKERVLMRSKKQESNIPSESNYNSINDIIIELEVYVREPAQHNLATNRVRQLVAQHCNVPIERVRMQSGARSRNKTFVVQ